MRACLAASAAGLTRYPFWLLRVLCDHAWHPPLWGRLLRRSLPSDMLPLPSRNMLRTACAPASPPRQLA